jgi:hypothetical protein
MEHGRMAYRYAVSENRREPSLRHVNDRVVLDVGVLTDSYMVTIAAQDAIEPDAGVLADVDVANYVRAFGDECAPGYLRADAFVRDDHRLIS